MPLSQSKPPDERLSEFNRRAEEARQSAANAPNAELRKSYEQLAAAWEQIIREIERRG